MTLSERIQLVQARRKRQLLVASLLTLATTAAAVSAVLSHSVISIVSAAVIAGCMLLQWSVIFTLQAKEEVYTVVREQLESGKAAEDQ
jgi:hypothetical protein